MKVLVLNQVCAIKSENNECDYTNIRYKLHLIPLVKDSAVTHMDSISHRLMFVPQTSQNSRKISRMISNESHTLHEVKERRDKRFESFGVSAFDPHFVNFEDGLAQCTRVWRTPSRLRLLNCNHA